MTKWLLILLLLLTIKPAFAQSTAKTPEDLVAEYNNSKMDTNKVRILLLLDSVYLYKMPDTDNILDSALLMAQQARTLSTSLHFNAGYNDATFLFANAYAEKRDMQAALMVANSVTGPPKIHILIMLGERYLFRPGELKENTDSAYIYIANAEQLSDSIHSVHWLYQSLCLKGKYYFKLGDIDNGRRSFKRIIDKCRQAGDIRSEAHWWAELGRYMPHTDTYEEVIANLKHAYVLYRSLNSTPDEIELLEDLAFLHKLRPDSLDLAETELHQAIKLHQSIGAQGLYNDYTDLSQINTLKGNYNISLYYALAAVKDMDSLNKGEFSGGTVYTQLATAYKAVGDIDNSLLYFKKAMDHLVDYRTEYLYPICGEIVHALLQKNNAQQALSFMQKFVQENPPVRYIDKEVIAASMGDCYSALEQYNKAENLYLKMIVLDSQAQSHMTRQSIGERSNTITGSEAYYTIGNFYVNRKAYALAKGYLQQAISFKHFAPSLARQRDIHLLLFRIDSAQGNYFSAIQHLQLQQQLQDSIFNDRKSKQIAELQIQYETTKKEKDLQLMRSKEQVKDKELQRTVQVRNFTYLLIGVLIVLICVVYSRYLLKQRSNRQLQVQQQLINTKNKELQYLLNDKDKLLGDKDNLLEEKEWLLKEVHHRVKNNLQIMTSLLNTQAKYLDNAEAVNAIAESRHRMQAMSLIHQKLYESFDTSSVNMHTFIGELIDYLEVSFHNRQEVTYDLRIDDIKLEITQAIPIGLVLNEAITNALKYAFTNMDKGNIIIVMQRRRNHILLTVRDNGKGLPVHFLPEYNNSMGMRLMRGLIKQIDGHITIVNDNGVYVKIEFGINDRSS